jgi:hypothetical protein
MSLDLNIGSVRCIFRGLTYKCRKWKMEIESLKDIGVNFLFKEHAL